MHDVVTSCLFFLVAMVSSAALIRMAIHFAPAGFLAATMRSQHAGASPIRQLGGIGVVPVLLSGTAAAGWLAGAPLSAIAAVFAIAPLWLVGLFDDHRHVGVGKRLMVQFAAAAMIVAFALPGNPWPQWMPAAMALVIEILFLVWFMNLTNFMDGMDGMTVAGLGMPLVLSAMIAGLTGGFMSGVQMPVLVAFCAAGALAGFFWFNRPPARIYLGDNGALPCGLVAGWLVLVIAGSLGLVVALLPFGYYLADSGLTIARRMLRGEDITRSHTGHYYQRAMMRGVRPWRILAVVAMINLVLACAALLMTDTV